MVDLVCGMDLMSLRRQDYVMILCFHLLNHLLMFMLPTLILFFRSDFGLSYTDAGLLWTSLIVVMTTLSVGVGFFSDRFRSFRYFLILSGLFLMSLVWLFLSFSVSVWQLYLGFTLMGVGASTFHPPVLAIITEMFEDDKGKALSLNMAIGMGGTAVSPIVFSGLGLLVGGWEVVARVIGIGGLVFLFVLGILGYVSGMFDRTNWSGRRGSDGEVMVTMDGDVVSHSFDISFIFSGLVLVPLLFISLRSSFFRTASVFTSLLYEDYLHLTKNESTVATALVLGFASMFTLVGGFLSDRTRPRVALVVSSVGSAFASVGLVYLTDYADLVSFSTFYFLLLAFYYVGSPAGSALLADRVEKEQRGKLFGALFSLGQVLSLLTPLAFGWIKDNIGLSASFLMIMVLALIALVLSFYIYFEERGREKEGAEL
ncbi:MAG: MFS transporter [Methanobacteriota archaeon]|nr:MAG: MFS transporter [Euryarchaeota archaeon]